MTKIFTRLGIVFLLLISANLISAQSICLVGDAAEVSGLPSAEQQAYNWALNFYGSRAAYISFSDIASNGLPTDCKVVWFHFEDDATLPSSAASAAANIESLLADGGGLLVSGFATEYALTVNATDVAPSETIDKDPAGPDAAWGIKPLAGQEGHPIFANIAPTSDWADANWGGYRTVGADVAGREAIRWWTGGSYPGTPLGAMPWWDVNNTEIPVVGEISTGTGKVVTCTAPGYNWVSANINTPEAQGNIERLSANMLNYLNQEVAVVLLGDAVDVAGLPSAEQEAYNWALNHFGAGAMYMSFSDVASEGLPATARAAWYHFEDDPNLPASGADAASTIEAFVEQGGGLVVSGFATEYALSINATDVAPSETIDKDPAGPDVAWGIKPLAGQEGHPIFAGLSPTADWADANWGGFRTVGAEVAGREAIRWWTGGNYPGTPIAVMPWWDSNNSEIPVVGTIAKGSGTVVTCSAPGYNWVSAAINDAAAQANLEGITANMLSSVTVSPKILLVGEGGLGDLSSSDAKAYDWALSTFGFEAAYSSFEELAINGIPASAQTIWYHQEDSTSIPSTATAIADMIGNFVQEGGRIVTSSFATEYLVSIGASDVAPTETISNNPAGPDAAWGIKPLAGRENHPFFADLTPTTDWADANWGGFRTIGAEVAGHESIRWWTGGAFPGEAIAVMPWWDANNSEIPIIGTLGVGQGEAVFMSGPGYQWLPSDVNEAGSQANLEQLTTNILTYEEPDFQASILMIGDAAAISALPQGEQNAYNWAATNFEGAAGYLSFEEVNNGGIPASVETVWYHYEDTSMLAGNFAAIADKVGTFVSEGGGLLLSGFATQIVVDAGITEVGPTEVIDKDPAGPDVAWGVKPLAGLDNHPIFAGLTPTTDWADANWGGFRTIGAEVAGREAMAWWTGGAYPGTPLAVMPWWDVNNGDIPVIGEILSGSGGVVTASAPGYHWKNADINTADAQANLELLTENMLNYVQLFKESQSLIVTGGTDGIIAEGEEAGQVINVNAVNATYVASPSLDQWVVDGIPAGVTVELARVDDNNVSLTLGGQADDYDEDVPLHIAIPANQFVDLRTDTVRSEGDVVFDGIVEVDEAEGKVALLGTEASIDLLDEDEQAAYNWALNRFGEDAQYFSFEDIVLNPEVLNEFAVAWFHYDKFIDLPLLADNPNTENVLRGFRESGGGMFLTGAASQYVVNLGVETAGPNEVRKAEEPFTNPDPWGFGVKEPDHPAFVNLTNPFFTLFSENGLREDLLAWWVINPSDERFEDIPVEDRFHGKQLASTEWDAAFNILVTVAEYEGGPGEGNTIAVGAGAFDWYLEGGENTLRDNLELFAFNCLNYLKTPAEDPNSTNNVSLLDIPVLAYPNPAQDEVSIAFSLPSKGFVKLEIFDMSGKRISTVNNGILQAGQHTLNWNAATQEDGLYVYKLQVGNKLTHGKIAIQQ